MDFVWLLLQLILDTSASWVRMFIALGLSLIISIAVGVYAATSRTAEKILIPIVDILQTVPILAFFPVVIFVFVFLLPGYIGINAAVIFLIVTSMVWNIILGVYESVKTIPKEFMEVAELYHFDGWSKLRRIYFPAAFPRIVEQSILSWSIGLFYLVTSEIFSIGNTNYQVKYGIGTALISLASQGSAAYILGIAVFIVFVVATRFLFFKPLEDYSTKHMRQKEASGRMHYEKEFLDWIGKKLPRNRAVFDSEGFSVAAQKKHAYFEPISHITRIARPKIDISRFYAPLALLILVVVALIFASNGSLAGQEAIILQALAASFARVWLAFLAILVISIPLSVYIIFMTNRSSEYLLLFQVMASIPATILLPAIAVGFSKYPGHGELVAFVIFFLSGIWYIIFSIIASTRTLPSNVFEVQKIFGVKGKNAWRNIYIKAILPGLVTGAMTGIAAEWNASIVAEYFTTTGISGSTVISSVSVGMGKLLDTSLTSGGGGLAIMGLALLNLVVMILIINTFLWKRFYKKLAGVYS